jgi:hypothetical protein
VWEKPSDAVAERGEATEEVERGEVAEEVGSVM